MEELNKKLDELEERVEKIEKRERNRKGQLHDNEYDGF